MSVAQAARIPRGISLTPPSFPVRSMLLSTSLSLKHQPAPTTISGSSGSATSVNLPQTRFDSVEAYHERQECIMDKAYMTEEMASPRSDTASEASEQMMFRRRVELEDFELIRVVGKGCAGRVLMVRHAHTHQIQAMKAISKRSVLANEELDHTLAELSILKRMGERSEGPSAFVSRLDYAFTDRDNFYFVMEFYSGGDLATQMETLKRLGERRTRFYAADLVQGLEELHREGIIARDLKPENILINAQGHAVLADFGLAKEFSYRGDPEPLHVSRYHGEPALPWWAGKGAGSRRSAVSGRERVVYDRAQSFVGTSEYLAPEVVRRLDYSYAVDWWALGCIIFECLVGQAPFKLNEEEDLMDLWEQIIESPWTEFFDQPRHIDIPWKSWKIREPTFELLDGLLQKDPMRRLTEPCIKQMAFFANVDWETVKRGEYRNPRPLKIDRDPTLNMRYFPKLCLDEDVSVDMTKFHQYTPEDETVSVGEEVEDASGEAGAAEDKIERKDKPKNLTALNDYPTYIAEQARFRDELERFYYVSPAAGQDEQDLDEDDDYDMDMDDVSSDEEESSFGGDHLQYYYGSSPRQPEYRPMDEEVLMVDDSVELPEQHADADRKHHPAPPTDQAPRTSSLSRMQEHHTDLPTIVPRPPTPSIGDPPLDHARSDPELDRISRDNAMSPSSSVGEEVITTPSLAPVALDSIVSPLSMATPLMPQVAGPPMTPVDAFSVATSLPKVRDEIPPDSPTPVRKFVDLSKMPSSPVAISPKIKVLVEQDEAIICTSLSPRLGVGARLPSGLPASGLSTSDVVSVPSLGSAQNRIVRRNPHLAVDDHPPARLSVEVHGTVTRLDEDDWEAVDFGSDIPSMPNGSNSTTSPGTFLSRLRRKPSVIITSTMRRGQRTVSSGQRGHRSSDSGSSRVPSPTKGLVTPVKQLFGRRNIKLSRFRAFPGAKNRKSETSDTSALNSTSMLDLVSPSLPPSPTKNKGELEALGFGKSPERPIVGRRHTESGWFDKLRKSSRRAAAQPSSVATSAQADSDLGRSANNAEASVSGSGRSLSDGEKPAAQPIRRNTELGLSAEPSAHAVTRDGGQGEANEDLRRKSEEVAPPKSRFLPEEDSLPPLVWEYGDIEIGGDASKLL